jgi:ATP-dependent DNA ligase
MADIKYMKAVEWDNLSAKFKKTHSQRMAAMAGMWLQRKYDGCFGRAYVHPERTLCTMESREGNDYSKSCAGILDDLHALAENCCSPDPFVVLGEVWLEGVPFADISGRFRRQTKGVQALGFVMHDILPPDMESERPYSKRYDDLKDFYLQGCDTSLSLASTYKVGEWDGDPLEWAIKWKAEGGYDGAILRDPKAPYTTGLVKNGEVVKVKPVLSLDLQCAGLFTAEGEKTGRDVYTIGVCYRGVLTMVGSGVPHRKNFCPQPCATSCRSTAWA